MNQSKPTVNILAGRVTTRTQELTNDVNKKKKFRRTRSKHVKSNPKLPGFHEEYGIISDPKKKNGEAKIQGGKVSVPFNLQPNPAARNTTMLSSKKRKKIVVDVNDLNKELEDYMAAATATYVTSLKEKDELNKELEDYMAAAPAPCTSSITKDESMDIVDFDADLMDIEVE